MMTIGEVARASGVPAKTIRPVSIPVSAPRNCSSTREPSMLEKISERSFMTSASRDRRLESNSRATRRHDRRARADRSAPTVDSPTG